jgi:hypothetical protein
VACQDYRQSRPDAVTGQITHLLCDLGFDLGGNRGTVKNPCSHQE